MNRAANHNVQIAAVLAWEFWAHGWPGIVLAPFGALVLPGFIFGMLSWQYVAPIRDTEVGALLQFSFYWMVVLLVGAPVLAALGKPVRRYTLPAPSILLVAVPMMCGMLTVFAEYAGVALSLNAVFDAGWPILMPGLLAAVLIAWCQAVIWSTSNSEGLQALTCLVSAVPLVYGIIRLSAVYDGSRDVLVSVGVWHLLALGMATTACIGAGSFGFARLRRGAGIDVGQLVAWLRRFVPARNIAHAAPFSSAPSAQLWLEWTERGRILPWATALVGLVLLVVAWYVPEDGDDFVRGAAGFFLAPLLVIGIFWGSRSSQFEFASFKGSRPLSDSQIANAVLKSSTIGLLSSAAMWVAFMAAVVWLMGENLDTSKLFRESQQIGAFALLTRIALGATAVWSGVGFVTSLSLAGSKALAIAIAIIVSTLLAGLWLPLCLSHASRPAFTHTYTLVCLVFCFCGTAAAFITSWRRHLIGVRTACVAATIILAAVAVVYASGLDREWRFLLPGLVGCGVLPIPLAAAPLAVYVNRHR